MNSRQLAKLALAGMLGASSLACSGNQDETSGLTEKQKAAQGKLQAQAKATTDKTDDNVVNTCRGNNECKGLGGCRMSQEQIEEYAKKSNIEPKGSPHMCSGQNECKGLGGCKVTKKLYAKLKMAQQSNVDNKVETTKDSDVNESKKGNACGGANSCGGMNGCCDK